MSLSTGGCMTASSARPRVAGSRARAVLSSSGGLGQVTHSQLLNLSDTRGLRDLVEARDRVAAIAAIFGERVDLRGAFPLIYSIGLDAVVAAWTGGRFTDPGWVQVFDVAFVKRYLDNLHRHLRGQKTTPPWAEVYRRLESDRPTVGPIVGAAVNAHLLG